MNAHIIYQKINNISITIREFRELVVQEWLCLENLKPTPNDIVENFVDNYVVEETFVPAACTEENGSENVMFELLKQIIENSRHVLQQLKIQPEIFFFNGSSSVQVPRRNEINIKKAGIEHFRSASDFRSNIICDMQWKRSVSSLVMSQVPLFTVVCCGTTHSLLRCVCVVHRWT